MSSGGSKNVSQRQQVLIKAPPLLDPPARFPASLTVSFARPRLTQEYPQSHQKKNATPPTPKRHLLLPWLPCFQGNSKTEKERVSWVTNTFDMCVFTSVRAGVCTRSQTDRQSDTRTLRHKETVSYFTPSASCVEKQHKLWRTDALKLCCRINRRAFPPGAPVDSFPPSLRVSLLFHCILTEIAAVINLCSAARVRELYTLTGGEGASARGSHSENTQLKVSPRTRLQSMHECVDWNERRNVFACVLACAYVCVCVPSPLDGLRCLVCMVSVPTTAPMFAAVVVETSASVRWSLYLFGHVFGRLQRTLPRPLPTSHPLLLSLSLPTSSLSGCSRHKPSFFSIIPSFMLSHSISRRPSPLSLSLSPPFLPTLSYSLSLPLPGCSLPPFSLFISLSLYISITLPPSPPAKSPSGASVIQYEIGRMLIHWIIN